MEATHEEIESRWRDGSDCFVAHTSGSTGVPKRIELPKSLMRESALRTNAFFGISRDSVLCSCVSLKYIGGIMMVVRSLEAQCQFIPVTPSNSPQLPDAEIDLLAIVPSQLSGVIDQIESGSRVKNIIIGGSALPPHLSRLDMPGVGLYETYGMTETASHVALRKTTDEYFTPIQGIKIEKDTEDRVIIKMDGREPLITNDLLAEQLPDGRFRIGGRIDDAIVTGSLKLHPVMVEKEMAHLFLKPFVISGRPHPKWGEEAVLVATEEIDFEQIKSQLRNILPAWQIPKALVVLNELPLTGMGKPDRKKVRQMLCGS